MAVLQVLSTVLLLVCWGALQTHGQQLGFSLNGQSIANNSNVVLRNIGEDAAALLCTTDRTACCTGTLGRGGEWFYPDGRIVPIMDPRPPATAEPYYRNRGTSLIRLNRRPNQGLSVMYTGVYCCKIPDQDNVMQTLCVGAYLTESAGVPSISELTFSATTRTLTCISTGGRATNVTWKMGGSELTVDGSVYQFMQTLTEESTATYTNVLTIVSTDLTPIIGSNFTCEVENSRGTANMNVTIPYPPPDVTIQTSGSSTAGGMYTLSCTATIAAGLPGNPTVSLGWLGPSGAAVTSGSGVTLGAQATQGTTTTRMLTFNPLHVAHAGGYTCQATLSTPDAPTGNNTSNVSVIVPNPTVQVEIRPAAVTYAGNNVNLRCTATLLGGVTETDVRVNITWTRSGAPFAGISGRVIVHEETVSSTVFYNQLQFSLLSSSTDNGTYVCMVTLTPVQQQFVIGATGTGSMDLNVIVPTVELTLTPNTTRLPNVAPYNTFSLNCTATSSVQGSEMAFTKSFTWSYQMGNRVGATTGFTLIQMGIVNRDLSLARSTSELTVSETTAGMYTYRCQANLVLSADNIFGRNDYYPIIVTGPSDPEQPTSLTETDTSFNGTTIHWTVTRIAYTPESYTVHFGNSSDSLTPFNQGRQSGDNFTATNLQFSIQLTGLTPATDYSYRVVATNTIGRTNMSMIGMFRTLDIPPTGPVQNFMAVTVAGQPTVLTFSWDPPLLADRNGVIIGYQLSCDPQPSTFPRVYNQSGPVNTGTTLNVFTPGTTYTCRVLPGNSAGNGPPASRPVTTLEAPPGSPPANFTISASGPRSLTFSWEPPILPHGVIIGYRLSCSPQRPGFPETFNQSTRVEATRMEFAPDADYTCSVFASTRAGDGPSVNYTVRTLETPPEEPENFAIMVGGSSDLTFIWDPPLVTNGEIDNYTLTCSPTIGLLPMVLEAMINNITLPMFVPGTTYTCSLRASNGGGLGSPAVDTATTLEEAPGTPPENVQVTAQDSSSVVVSWQEPTEPNGRITHYTVYVNGSADGSMTSGPVLTHIISGLSPAQLVRVRVSASTLAGEGPQSNETAGMSRDGIAGPVSSPTAVGQNENTLIVTWGAPLQPNGTITQYTVSVFPYDGSGPIRSQTVPVRDELRGVFNADLEPGVPYNVSVRAMNGAPQSGVVTVIIAYVAPRPARAPRNVDVQREGDGSSMSVAWDPLSPVEARGFLEFYQVAYMQSTTQRKRQVTTCLQAPAVCMQSPCQVCPNQSMVTIGGLVGGAAYSVTVGARNGAGPGTVSEPFPALSPVGINIAVVIAIVVVVSVVVVGTASGVCCCCYMRRRVKRAKFKPTSSPPASPDGFETTDFGEEKQSFALTASKGLMQSEEDLANVQLSAPVGTMEHQVMDRLKAISISAFAAHVRSMHHDRDKGFELEYQSISNEAVAASEVAKQFKNRNRFANIFPYDFSRVKLQEIEGVEGSDYVNASYIDGYNHPNAYIAAQGPMPNTINDFWRMIWEYKLVTVVMLTKCTEAGKRKCEQYWPDNVNDTMTIGNLSITLTDLVPFADYEIKRFSAKDPSKPDTPALNVTHYHFLGWPDHGVPKFATSLIAFIRRVRKSHKKDGPPMLVHCSAGVGRTGTFILLDSMLERMKAEDTVNVYAFLRSMRAKRVFMVQTLAQYVFIHDALEELITCGETDISATNLRMKVNKLYKIIPGKAISGFEEQFNLLDSVSRKASAAECSDALQHYNKHKNRYEDRVPYNLSRTRLRPTGVTGAEYYNASFIDGYKLRNAYIAAQAPLRETVNDFWRMIWEFKSKAIVMLCNLEEGGQEACYPFWPVRQGEAETYGKLLVTLQEEEPGKEYTVRKFEIKDEKPQTPNQNQISSVIVTLFHYTEWPEHDRPSSTTTVLKLIEEVNKVQRSTGNRPITIMCNDGMGRTGTFLCIHALLEQVKSEGLVDFFQFVKSSRIHRPSIISDLEQYIFGHETLADYLDSFDTYANFKDLGSR